MLGADGDKQPYYLHPPQGQLHLAALYGYWRNPDFADDDPQVWLVSATILTTEATDGMGVIHDRTPMTVPPGAWDEWLHPGEADPDALRALLVPATVEVAARPVSRAVNSVKNNFPELIESVLV